MARSEERAITISPASKPVQETTYPTGQQDDLDLTIPGVGVVLGGDGATAYPAINIPALYEGPNPLQPVPANCRPIPTGTALGPSGGLYGFYSIVTYAQGAFIALSSTLVDLADPTTILARLSGISQASAAYSAVDGRMVVIGNTARGRGLWISAETTAFRGDWWNTLYPPRYFSGALNGDREQQIVALPNRALLLVAASNDEPIVAATATTLGGLLAARAVPILQNTDLPDGMYPYGPTIVDMETDGDKTVCTMRVSTWGTTAYDPHTWLTQFTVSA